MTSHNKRKFGDVRRRPRIMALSRPASKPLATAVSKITFLFSHAAARLWRARANNEKRQGEHCQRQTDVVGLDLSSHQTELSDCVFHVPPFSSSEIYRGCLYRWRFSQETLSAPLATPFSRRLARG